MKRYLKNLSTFRPVTRPLAPVIQKKDKVKSSCKDCFHCTFETRTGDMFCGNARSQYMSRQVDQYHSCDLFAHVNTLTS